MKFLVCLLAAGMAYAATLPDTLGEWRRASVSQPALQDQPVWTELGLKDSETAAYEKGAAKFQATIYHLQDTTTSLAAFDWLRPADSKPSKAAALAAATPTSLLLVYGNYLLQFDGYKPAAAELAQVTSTLQKVDHTALPTLYLPSKNLVPNSERYIIGPAALQKFSPQIPTALAGFPQGAEAESAVFHSSKGDVSVVVFNYPTWAIARQRAAEFEKLPGIMVKRSGPLVSVTLTPADPDLASKVLSQVLFRADVTLQERVPTLKDNIGNLVINAFVLIGILLCFALACGVVVGGIRAYQRYGKEDPDGGTLISLHLE
ncbi:MAG TPA: DUF6599 family protein [Candidatus Sulfopaludibacter sp.]|jgi:hypothetical protein|nr:DUF6599 family protein [Candidatus Sulfopaludibacter sp.]